MWTRVGPWYADRKEGWIQGLAKLICLPTTVVQEIYGGEYRGAYTGNTCVGNWPPIPPGWGQLLIPKSKWAYLCQGVLHYEYVVPRFGVQVVC